MKKVKDIANKPIGKDLTKKVLLFSFLFSLASVGNSQGCCAGGSGNPITGGSTQGVLKERQFEFSSSFQSLNSDKFLTGDRDTAQLFESFTSNYIYSRLAYGITKKFTLSIESGYFINKTQTGLFDSTLNKSEHIQSSGIADLIIFPKYDIFNRTTARRQTELTLGIGYKLPIGSHTDSILVFTNPISGQQFFTTSPPLVQPTTGSHDFIFYSFFYRGFVKSNFRIFTNVIYIKKGWNSLGEKFGDYSSVALFFGKTFFNKFGATLQIRAEHINKMQAAQNIDLLAYYNVDIASTGSSKIALVPQLNFTHRSFTAFALYEIPLYEYVRGTQVASKHQITFGIAYRLYAKKKTSSGNGKTYACSMHCEGGESDSPGKCVVCGMEMELQK